MSAPRRAGTRSRAGWGWSGIVGVVLLAAACGSGADRPAAAPDLSGRLGGDARLEGGCAWLATVEGRPAPDPDVARYEPVWPEGYRIAFDPLRLLGPDGSVVAREGDLVRVRGAVADDAVTVCQVGPVFEVSDVIGAG